MMCSTITSVMPQAWICRTSSIAPALGRGQPGQRLVEQQHPGFGRQRAGDLEPLAARRAETCAGAPPMARPALEHARALRAHRARCGCRRKAPTMTFSSTVIARRSPAPGRCARCRPRMRLRRQARSGRGRRRSRGPVGRQIAGKTVEEGRFAGAVRADQPDDLALLDRIEDVHRPEAAEGHGDGWLQAARARPSARRGAGLARQCTPPGSKRATSTMMAP